MQFNPIAFAATKAFIDSKGLVGSQDSSSIAVVASMLGNPVVSLFAGRSMAEKKAAEQAVPPPAPAPAATGAPVTVAPISPAPAPAGGASASPGAPTATLPTGPELDKLMKDMTARANEFIEKAEKQLKEVQEAAMAGNVEIPQVVQEALRAYGDL